MRSRRSNLRVLYGILAKSALENFDATEQSNRRIYFLNLIRLLEMYRFDSLKRTSPRAVLDRRQTDVRVLRQERSDTSAVERALHSAHLAVFPDLSKDAFVARLKGLFNRVVNSDSALSHAELRQAQRFLEELSKALSAPDLDPEDGSLQSNKTSAAVLAKDEALRTRFVNDQTVIHKVDGTWFIYKLEAIPAIGALDVFTKQFVKPYRYGPNLYHASKKQLKEYLK
jgi:hypothetical protein